MTDTRSPSAMRARRENEIRHLMTAAFKRHKEAREELARRLEAGELINAFAIRPVLSAQADMLPWAQVQRIMRQHTHVGLYQAMLDVRSMMISTVLGYPEAVNSDQLALEIDRVERDGMRRYIKATARFLTPPDQVMPKPTAPKAEAVINDGGASTTDGD